MAVRTNPVFLRPHHGIAAFSLVEVVLAMGVVAFGLIVIVALLPIGLKSNRDSIEESQAVNLLQALVADRHAAGYGTASPVYNLPALANVTQPITGSLYLMADAVTTNAVAANARYRVTYTVYPSTNTWATATNFPAAGPPQPVTISFQVGWPAAAVVPTATVETLATFMTP